MLTRLNVDPSLLKSVEVLRGPASVLYGSGAVAGVVSLTTKDAGDLLTAGRNLGARLRLGFQGAYNGQNLGGAVFGRIGAFDLLGDFNTRDTEDFRQGGGTTMPLSGQDSNSDLFKLGWFPSPDHQARLSSTGYRTSSLSIGNPQQAVTETSVLRQRDTDQRFNGIQYEFAPTRSRWLQDVSVHLNQSDFSAVERQLGSEAAGTVADDGSLPPGSVDRINDLIDQGSNAAEEPESPPPPSLYELTSRGASVLAGMELPWWPGRFSIGADYADDVGQARSGGEPINNFPDAEQSIAGVFVQQELDLFEHLGVIGGLRYDRYQNTPADFIDADEFEEDAISLQLGGTVGLPALIDRWLPGWGEGWSISALYGEAFRAPSLREAYSFGTHFLGNEFVINPNLRPEKAANKEVSLRYRPNSGLWLFDDFQASLTGYQNDVRDFMELIVTVEVEGPFPPAPQCVSPAPPNGCINQNNPTAPPIFIGGETTTVNLPRARLRGLELDIEWGIGWLESRLKFAQVRGVDLDSGEPLSAIPADTASLDLGGRFGAIYSGLNLSHTADQNRVPLPKEDRIAISQATPGYTVLNWRSLWSPRVGWLKGANLAFAVDNLLDERYRNHLTFDESHYEVGRNVKLSLAMPI